MVSYNNSNVVQCLRQYDMFANSLNLVKTREERDMIIKQLTKLENKIIDLTNEIYEEEYYALSNKECGLIEEEQNRLNMLIDLIKNRYSLRNFSSKVPAFEDIRDIPKATQTLMDIVPVCALISAHISMLQILIGHGCRILIIRSDSIIRFAPGCISRNQYRIQAIFILKLCA